jgi:hypothetical protein
MAIGTDIERKYGVKTLSTARSESSGSSFRCSDRSERGWTIPGVSPVKESPLSWFTMLTEDKLFNLTYVEAIFTVLSMAIYLMDSHHKWK